MVLTFNSEDIFKEIPGDPDNVTLEFPPEVIKSTGWQVGDLLTVTIKDNAIVIKKNG
jgi:hypothetical protein